MSNLDIVLKSRDITLLTEICIVKAMVVPVVTYRRESWTIMKAECRIDDFERCCRRLLRALWTARRGKGQRGQTLRARRDGGDRE